MPDLAESPAAPPEPSPSAARVLDAVARRPAALVRVGELARSFNRKLEWVLEAAVELVEAGRLECWRDGDGVPWLCYTPAEAARRGLKLTDSGQRWIPVDAPLRPQQTNCGRHILHAETDLLHIDHANGVPDAEIRPLAEMVDPSAPDPASQAGAAEAGGAAYTGPAEDEGKPRPAVLLGEGMIWPVPGQARRWPSWCHLDTDHDLYEPAASAWPPADREPDGRDFAARAAYERHRAQVARQVRRDDRLRFTQRPAAGGPVLEPAGGACRVCGGTVTDPATICLACHAWGLDRRLAATGGG